MNANTQKNRKSSKCVMVWPRVAERGTKQSRESIKL